MEVAFWTPLKFYPILVNLIKYTINVFKGLGRNYFVNVLAPHLHYGCVQSDSHLAGTSGGELDRTMQHVAEC